MIPLRSQSLSAANTPGKRGSSSAKKTPKSGTKTPLSAAKLRNITPSRNHSYINNSQQGKNLGGGDRYVANRSESDLEMAHYLMIRNNSQASSASTSQIISPNTLESQEILSERLNGGVTGPNSSAANFNFLTFAKKPAPPPEGYVNHDKVLYNGDLSSSSCRKTIRHIPSEPERILDAPEIVDDFYLNLIDWGPSNLLAAALGPVLYVWDPVSSEIDNLASLDDADHFCAVQWATEGPYLALSDSTGSIQLYDVEKKVRLRYLDGHSDRVGVLAWNSHILSSGCRDGLIIHHDVRVHQHRVGLLQGHQEEVCGLKWSPDGQRLASGGNDNKVNIWQKGSEDPLHSFDQHCAAVKAIAWCPWQPAILASGGGTSDRNLRIWNATMGSCLESVDTNSQVSSILWSNEHRELISAHGYPKNQLCIWKYPSMAKIGELIGHSMRILNMSMSPCGQFVISASADESIRMWKCFAVDPKRKSKQVKATARAAEHRHPQGTVLPKANVLLR